MNKKRHDTFFVLERELFSLKKIQKKIQKRIQKKSRHSTARAVARAVVREFTARRHVPHGIPDFMGSMHRLKV